MNYYTIGFYRGSTKLFVESETADYHLACDVLDRQQVYPESQMLSDPRLADALARWQDPESRAEQKHLRMLTDLGMLFESDINANLLRSIAGAMEGVDEPIAEEVREVFPRFADLLERLQAIVPRFDWETLGFDRMPATELREPVSSKPVTAPA